MSAKNLFRRLMTKALRSRPTDPIRSGRGRLTAALAIESLEDRTVPALTFNFTAGGVIQVGLTTGDTANVTLKNGNIEVRDQFNTLAGSEPVGVVTGFQFTGDNGALESVNLNGPFTLTGAVAATAVTGVSFNSPESAGSVSVTDSSFVSINAALTTSGAVSLVSTGDVTVNAITASGTVDLLADNDGNGAGNFLLSSGSVNSTGVSSPTPATAGHPVTISGAGITFNPGTNISAGTSGVSVNGSSSNFTYTAPVTNVITNTSGNFQVNSYDPAARVWAADTTVASFTGSYVLFIQRAASLTLNGINTSAAGNAIFVNVGDHNVPAGGNLIINGAVNAGTGSVTLNADNAGLGGPSAVIGSQVTLTALTAVGSLAQPVVTVASQLNAVDQTGGIWISNTGDVSLVGTGINALGNGSVSLVNAGSVAVSNGAAVSTGNGNITVQANGAAANISAGGNSTPFNVDGGAGGVSLSAGQDILLGDVNGSASALTAGGAVSYTAGRNIVLDNQSQVHSSGGTIGLTATHNITFAKTATAGTHLVSGGGGITITAGTGAADTVDYEAGASSTINSGGGGIAVVGNNLVITGGINAAGGTVTLRAGTSNAGGTASIGTASVAANITGSTVAINGGTGADTFNLVDDAGSTLNVNGAAPVVSPGDTVNLPSGGGSNAVAGPGNGIITGATTLPTVTYTSIESFTSATANPTALVISTAAMGIGNNGGADTVNLIRNGTNLEVRGNGTLFASVDYASVGAIAVNGSSDTDTLVVDNSGGLITQQISYAGGGGANNALVVQGNAGAGVTGVYTTSTAAPTNSGSLVYTQGANTEVITFNDLAPVESLTPVAVLTVNDLSNSTTENIVTGPTSTGTDPFTAGTATTYQVNFTNPAAEAINWRNATTVIVNGSGGNDTVTVNLPTQEDAGSPNQLTTLNVDSGSGTDEIDILATPAGVTTDTNTQAGVPDRTVIGGTLAAFNTGTGTLANINGAVSVTDSGGVGQLYVDDSGAAAGVTATLTATTIVVGAAPTITYNSFMTVVQLALTAQADTVNVTSTQSGASAGNTTITSIFGNAGGDTFNVSSSAPALTGSLAGIAGELDINSGAGADTLNVSDLGGAGGTTYTLGAAGGRTTLSTTRVANIVYDANGTAGQLENFNLTGSTAGGNTYAVNATTATTQTTINDGDTTTSGTSAFNINGDSLSGRNTFLGNGGLDAFTLNVATSIGQNAVAGGTIAGVTLDGGLGVGGAANDSNHRDEVTVNDNSGLARNLNVQYLATQGDLDVQPTSPGSGLFGANGNGLAALRVRGTETFVQNHAANNDAVTVTGTAGNDVLTVGLLQNNTSALVFLAGAPYLNAPPETVQGSLPGYAGGGTGTDLLIGGLSPAAGLTLNGGTHPGGGGDRAVVFAASEQPLAVAGGTLDYFGFGAGTLLPGFGTGNAVDTINVTDATVTTSNNSVGPLTTVHLNTASFVQGTPIGPNQQPALIVNGGDESGNQGDSINATISGNFNVQVNGNLPSQGQGVDHLIINAAGFVDVFSDTSSPPNVTAVSGGVYGVKFSSIEDISIAAATVNVFGDNNFTTPQADTFVVTGTGPNAFNLAINGSSPIRFSGVNTLNVSGGQLDDATTITPYATANHPWGIDVDVNGGESAGPNGDSLTYSPAAGLTNNTHVVATGPLAGNVDAHGVGSATTDHVVRFSNVKTVTVNDGGNAGLGYGDTLAVDLANGTDSDIAAFQFNNPVTHTTPDITLQDVTTATLLLQVNMDSATLPALTVNGLATADSFIVFDPNVPSGTGTVLPVALTVNGGAGANQGGKGPNTLTLYGRANQANKFTNTAGANPTSGTTTLVVNGNPASATVAYTGLQDPTYVGGGGTSADVLDLTGSGTLTVTGTGPGAGTATVTGQSGITFSNFGSNSTVNMTGTGGSDVFTINQAPNWNIPNVHVTEAPSSATALLQVAATAGSNVGVFYQFTPGNLNTFNTSLAATPVGGTTTNYVINGVTALNVDGGTSGGPPAAPAGTLAVSSFLPGTITLPSGSLGVNPSIDYSNMTGVTVGAAPAAMTDGSVGAAFGTTNAGTPISLDVTANDSWNTMGQNKPISIVVVTPPAHGTVTVDNTIPSDPRFVYTPATNYFGPDNFTYNLVDANGQVSPTAATVFVQVLGIAHTPTVTVTTPVTDPEASAVPVVITGALSPSANAAEVLTYTIAGVPANATFNHGTNAGGGVWAFTAAQLTGLTITDTDGPAGLNLTVTATSAVTAGVGGATAGDIAAPPANTATSAPATLLVTVTNVAPTATGLTNSGPVTEGTPVTVTLNGAADVSPTDTAAGLHFSFAEHPADLVTTYAATGAANTATFTFPHYGTYTVWGRVIDKDGGFTDYQTTVTVQASAHAPTVAVSSPVAENEGSPAPVTIIVSPSPNADPNERLTYQITGVPANATFNHGTNLGGGVWRFTAADLNGLTITDTDGPATLNLTVTVTSTVDPTIPAGQTGAPAVATTTAPLVVNVANLAPTAAISNTGPVSENSPVTVSLTGETDPSSVDATSLHYSFATTAGGLAATYAAAGTATSAQFTFPDGPSTHAVWARVIDKDGGFTDYQTTVTVNNVAPTAPSFTNDGPVNEGNTVTVTINGGADVSPTDTAAGLHYSFALNPGALLSTYANTGTANSAPFTLTTSGPQTIWGRIIDKDGGFTDFQTTVNVLAIAHTPTLTASSPLAANEGTATPVSMVAALAPNADPTESLTYSITGVPANATFNHGTNAGGGVWTFTAADLNGLTITDTDGPATLNLTASVTSTATGPPPAQVGTPAAATKTVPLVVNVANVAPTATFSVAGPFAPGQPFDIAFTDQADPSPADTAAGFTYQYDLGTGTFGPVTTSPTASFTPPTAGAYTVRGKITDKDGGFTIHTATAPGSAAGQVVPNPDQFAVGTGVGGGPIVHVYSTSTNQEVASIAAYEPTFRGGVLVSTGDLTGDGVPDIVTGTGPGGGPVVNVFDGKTFALLGSFFAYESTFRGGVTVAAGELNGRPVIVTGSGDGGGPVVKVFDGKTFALLESFFAYGSTLRGGVNVAVADVLGTGAGAIITGAGVGGGPNVRVFTGSGQLVESYMAYDSSFTGGVTVSAGDLYGTGYADVVTGSGVGGGGNLRVFDGKSGALVRSVFAFGPDAITGQPLTNGFTVSATHVGGADGHPVVIVGSGPGYGPTVRVFGADLTNPLAELLPYEDTFTGGAYVG